MLDLPENKRTATFPGITGGRIEVVLFSLSVKYMHRVEIKEIKDTPIEALKDASDLDEDEIFEYVRYDAAEKLYAEIIKLTFGKEDKEEEKLTEKKDEEVSEGTEKK